MMKRREVEVCSSKNKNGMNQRKESSPETESAFRISHRKRKVATVRNQSSALFHRITPDKPAGGSRRRRIKKAGIGFLAAAKALETLFSQGETKREAIMSLAHKTRDLGILSQKRCKEESGALQREQPWGMQ